jgi:hypothetical protein
VRYSAKSWLVALPDNEGQFPITAAGSTGGCNTIWYKAAYIGPVHLFGPALLFAIQIARPPMTVVASITRAITLDMGLETKRYTHRIASSK